MPEAQSLDPTLCPKCGKKHAPAETACGRCGLVFALWKADAVAPVLPLDARGEELWRNIQGNWSDSALHEEFVKHCLQVNTLAAAGRLYRERLDENPKDALAAQMQSQVLAKAALGLAINRTTTAAEPVTRSRWFWLIVLTAMALGIAGGLFWRRFR